MSQSHKCKCDMMWGFGYLNTGDSCFVGFARPHLHQHSSAHWSITCDNKPVAALTDGLSERLRPEARGSQVFSIIPCCDTQPAGALVARWGVSYSRKPQLLDLLFLSTLLCDCSCALPCTFSFCFYTVLPPWAGKPHQGWQFIGGTLVRSHPIDDDTYLAY